MPKFLAVRDSRGFWFLLNPSNIVSAWFRPKQRSASVLNGLAPTLFVTLLKGEVIALEEYPQITAVWEMLTGDDFPEFLIPAE